MRQGLGDAELLSAIARLVLVLAIVIATVAMLANKWRDDRPNDRFPGIVQDVAVIALFMAIATVIMRETLLTTSAVGAVVVGFALQDTLGNLFAGLAIQIEKPFRVGHWIQISGRDGQVQEITWRATKLRTQDGEFLIVPNSVIAKEPVLNYSEPTIANRVSVEVGASYLTPPNDVKRAIQEAIANSSLAMPLPEPQVVIKAFGGSSIDYLALFWIADYGRAREAQDQVRTNLWYTFRRRNIEIPWPIQIQYERQEAPVRGDADVVRAGDLLGSVDLFAGLTPESRQRARCRLSGAHLRCRRGDRPPGRAGRLDVRGPRRPRPRHDRAVRTGSGGDSRRRVLRRDVDADGRASDRHGSGGGRCARARDWRGGVQAACGGRSTTARSCHHGDQQPSGGPGPGARGRRGGASSRSSRSRCWRGCGST